jgi:hypothetical protein
MQNNKLLDQGTDVISNFIAIVNGSKVRDSNNTKLFLRRYKNYDVLHGPTPAAMILQATDGGIGHAVAIYKEYIVDSSWHCALPRTMESLDWSCSPAGFFKPKRVYVLTT